MYKAYLSSFLLMVLKPPYFKRGGALVQNIKLKLAVIMSYVFRK